MINFSLCKGLDCYQRVIFTEKVPLSYACYGTFHKGIEGKGGLKSVFEKKGINPYSISFSVY